MVQGNAFGDLKVNDRDFPTLYPSIGVRQPHAQLSVNLGQKPFVYDIDGMVSVSNESSMTLMEFPLTPCSARGKAFKMRSTLSTLRCCIILSARMICAKLS